MNDFELYGKKRSGLVGLVLVALGISSFPALAAPTVTSTPAGAFTVNGNTVTTGTSSGTYTGVTITNTGVATTVVLGQTNGTTLSLTNATGSAEISIGNGSSVTVLAGTTLNTTAATDNVLLGSGSVSNAGNIFGVNNAVDVTGAGTLSNTGDIIGVNFATNPPTAGNDGVVFGSGSVTNSGSAAVIEGFVNGVAITGAGGVNNSGTIYGFTNGINIGGAGSVNNTGNIFGVNNPGAATSGNDGVLLASGSVANSAAAGFIYGYVNGVEIDGAGSVNNIGQIDGLTNGVDITGAGSVVNSGSIFGGTGGAGNDGVLLASGSVVNNVLGSIIGYAAGVGITGNGTVNNAGSIVATTDGISVTGTGIVLNTGTISANTAGISTTGASSAVTLQGGSITTSGGGSNDVALTGATSSVTINGRSLLIAQGADLHDTVNDGTLNLHLVGVTPSQAAAIVAAERAAALAPGSVYTFTAGNETYSFQGFDSFNNNLVSLGQVVDPGLRQLGVRLDVVGLPVGTPGHTPYDAFYSAALISPEAAVEALSGRVLTQGTNDVEINSRSGLLSELGDEFDDIQESGHTGGIDFSHFTIGTDQMLAFTDTSSELSNLIQAAQGEVAGTEISDSKTMVPTPEPKNRWGMWASGTVQIANKSTQVGNEGFNAVNGSPSLGLDYRLTRDFTIGGLFSYTTVGANFSDGSNIESSTELGGLYGLWSHDGWRVHAVAAGGVSQYKDTRSTLDGTADSRPDGSDVISDVTGGYAVNLGEGFQVTPQAGLQYTHLHQDGFNEGGDPAYEINRGSFDADSLRTHVGFIVQRAFQIGSGLQFIPQLRAGWYHECLDGSTGVDTSLPGAPALGSFSIRTYDPERDYALVGIGLSTSFTGYGNLPVALFLNYDVQVGQTDFTQHNVNAGVRVAF